MARSQGCARVFVCSVAVPISATGAQAEEALVKIENVGQGSRQNRLVTLEEELALLDQYSKRVRLSARRRWTRLGWLTRVKLKGRLGAVRCRGVGVVCSPCASTIGYNEDLEQNCNSQRKPDSLIETKQSDSLNRFLRFVNSAQCFDCYCDVNHISASKQRE